MNFGFFVVLDWPTVQIQIKVKLETKICRSGLSSLPGKNVALNICEREIQILNILWLKIRNKNIF